MLKKVLVTLCFLSLLFSPITSNSTQASKAAENLTPSEDSFASDQLIIKLQPEAKVQNNTLSTHVISLDQALASVNAIALVPLAGLPETYILKMQSDANILDAVETLNREPAVDYAEPDYLAHFASVPDDPRYSEQWGLSKIAVEGAWDQTSGSPNVVIAVIDSGIDLTHEDLSPNLWINPGEVPGNSLDDDNNGFIDDIQGWNFVDINNNVQDFIGHGSLVAGVAAARSNNTLGIAGICGNCRVMPVKVSQVSGIANYSDIAAGVAYATQKGADVINISLGGYSNSNTLRNAIQAAVDQNISVVAGAGNDNSSNLFYPAAYDSVIGVSGTDQDDHKTASSNFGSWVDVSAPGVDILSTTLGDYNLASGTSFSAPFVSGNIGLLLSLHSDWTPAMIRSQLMHTADEIDGLNPDYEGMLGAGRLNATQAMQNPEPILQYQSYSGNGIPNLRPDFGSTVNLNIALYNDWADALGVSGVLSSTDSYVSIATPTTFYGDILAGETKANEIAFTFDIAAGAGYNHVMPFELALSANDGAYTTTLNFSITTRSSEETVSGTIAENRTWTNDKTYVVTNNVGLAPGYTLTIEAGTTIKFNGNYSLNLGGTLVAQGTAEQPILFEPYTSSITWNRIYFDNSSLDAQTTAEGDYLSGNVLQYVTVSGAASGIGCSSATPYLDHVTTDNGGVTCSLGETDLWVKDSAFLGTMDIFQGGIFPEHIIRVETNGGSVTLPASQVVDSNFFGLVSINGAGQVSNSDTLGLSISGLAEVEYVNAKGSISISSGQVLNSSTQGGGISVGSNSLVSNCTVNRGGISAGSGSTITHNSIENTSGTGINSSGASTITFNRVIGMEQGIIASSGIVENNLVAKTKVNGIRPGMASLRNNTMVMNEGNAVYLDQGPSAFEGNNFEFNTGEFDVTVSVPVTLAPEIVATNNWWGTTELSLIRERTYDYYDDYTLAALTVEPLLESPSQAAPGYVRNVTLDPESPVGIQTVDFTVEFSRPMDTNFIPFINFGSTSYDTWAAKIPMPERRYGLGTVKDNDGRIYVIGGNDGITSILSSVYEYDPILETWFQKASLNTARDTFGVTLGSNNKIYVIGGSNGSSCLSSVEEYDPITDTWTEKAPMSVGRCYFGIATSSDGKIYAFGGEDKQGNVFQSVEEYDPETNIWIEKEPMPGTRRGFGIVPSRNGMIYIIGGELILGEIVSSVEAYDPLTDTWTRKAPLITGRTFLGVVESQNGKIYAIGGIGGGESVEEYDPVLDIWSSKTPLTIGRFAMGVVEGNNQKIYVMGGYATFTNIDEYSPPWNPEIIHENPSWINTTLYSVDYSFSVMNSRDDYVVSVENAVDLDGIMISPDNRTTFTVDYAGEISDTTPPERPHVIAWGNGSLTQLSAQAYAKDPDSLIVGYRYAIGTSPGSVDVVNWTNISQNQVTHTGLSLLLDQPYYVSFQACNEGGLWSPIGVSNPVINGAELERLYLPLITR